MLPILPIAQMVYGGFNPYGTSKQPFVALGRSIAHGFGSGTGTPLGSGNIDFGTPTDATTTTPTAAAASTYFNTSNPNLQAAPPPQGPQFGGPDFGNFAQAQNNFIGGLQNWNGPGQAQGPSGEQTRAMIGGPDTHGSQQFLGLSRRLGGMGIDPNASMAHAIAASQQPTPGFATANLPKLRGKG